MSEYSQLISVKNWKYIFKTLLKNKVRSLLTALGIIIGVWAVIVLISIGNGLKVYVTEQFESLGANSIYVIPGNFQQMDQSGGFRPMVSLSFTEDDVSDLEKVDGVAAVSPVMTTTIKAATRTKDTYTELIGSNLAIKETYNLEIDTGRFFNSAEERRGRRVAVIGSAVKEELFGEKQPVGENIRIDNQVFEVIGSLKQKGSGGGFGRDVNDAVYTPYTAVWRLTEGRDFNSIIVSAETKDIIDQVKEEATSVLLESYDKDDFSVVDQSELLGAINDILNIFTIGLAGIAAVSLIVGGVGIMNVMFVSVNERTKEVGLRKAVGATNRDILIQFLSESVALSLIGGLIGFLLAVGTALIIDRFFPAAIATWSIFLALGVSTVVGVIFGITPSSRAAKLSPVEALRHE